MLQIFRNDVVFTGDHDENDWGKKEDPPPLLNVWFPNEQRFLGRSEIKKFTEGNVRFLNVTLRTGFLNITPRILWNKSYEMKSISLLVEVSWHQK